MANELPPAPHGTELIGPFVRREPFHLVVDGCLVPHVEFFKEPEGTFEACVDGRLSVLGLTETEIKKWGYVLANAMAVAAGLSHFGHDAQPAPFAPRIFGVTGVATETPERPKLELVKNGEGEASS